MPWFWQGFCWAHSSTSLAQYLPAQLGGQGEHESVGLAGDRNGERRGGVAERGGVEDQVGAAGSQEAL